MNTLATLQQNSGIGIVVDDIPLVDGPQTRLLHFRDLVPVPALHLKQRIAQHATSQYELKELC